MTLIRPIRSARVSIVLLLILAAAAFGAGLIVPWKPNLIDGGNRARDFSEPPPRSANDPVVALGRLRPAGGYLTISGPPGEGTTVRVSVSLTQPEASEASAAREPVI